LSKYADTIFFGDVRTIDVHVMKVSDKLGVLLGGCIHTIWGIGYKF